MNRLTLIAVLLMALAGCTKEYSTGPVTPGRHHGAGLRAGLATVDITPPPGLALFGHGPEGRVATGIMTRLRCQVFVLTQGDEPVVLLPCDLAAPSLELQRAIARAVKKQGVAIGADRILLMATHTHAGPAHYFGSKEYSGGFGARIPGYDERLVRWLAERIAGGIRLAYGRREQACAQWIDDAVWGLTRNRSYSAFAANGALTAELLREELAASGRRVRADEPPTDVSIDPRLTVLRLESCGATPSRLLGIFAVFGLHPTAIPNHNDLYHGDIFGFATRAVEAALESECRVVDSERRCPVVGIANGVEGDVSATWGYQGPREARRLGQALARNILRLSACEGAICEGEPPPRHDFAIRAAYRELALPDAEVHGSYYDEHDQRPDGLRYFAPVKDGEEPRLCEGGAIGTPAAGGAEDGPTRMRALAQMHEGHKAPSPAGCQGDKLVLTPPVSGVATDGLSFPSRIPISLVHLGDRLLAATPAELTTAVGYRLRDRLRRFVNRPGPRISGVVVVGLTNAWMQYITTSAEYAEQHYEGASTLYGPHSERFLSNHLLCLADWLYDGGQAQDECGLGQELAPGQTIAVPFDPIRADVFPERPSEPADVASGEDMLVRRAEVDGLRAYRIDWRGASPDYLQTPESLRVRVVYDATDETVDDDRGSAMILRHLRGDDWQALWFPELTEDDERCRRQLRFVVDGQAHHRSMPFLPECPEAGGSADVRQEAAP